MLHDILAEGHDRYIETLKHFAVGFPEWNVPSEPNPFFNSLDAMCLHGMINFYRPQHYIEIGSGYSTIVAKNAILGEQLSTIVQSVDPEPRIGIDNLCNFTHRRKLLRGDIFWITELLRRNDILFVDGSHTADSLESDVAILFGEIIPKLRPGVIVHFHDIWLPVDYPDGWRGRQYNEQYLLATYLASATNYWIMLPNGYISTLETPYGAGKSFWFTKTNM